MCKNAFVEIARLVHPRAVRFIKIDHKTLPDSVAANVLQFFFLYIGVFFIGTIIMSSLGLGFTEALSSVATTLGNVGPGLGSVGPACNFFHIPSIGKWALSFFMLIGRLEVYTVLVLLIPDVWKK
jgi:trk system potassium uptake protein TrkH